MHNVMDLLIINSRNINGYCRSWIEYLNERFNVCILDMSITLDTTIRIKNKFMYID